MTDLLNSLCYICHLGFFIETSVMDDINGTLHCSNCNYKVERHIINE